MASTFTAMSSVGSLAAPGCHVMDKKFASSSDKLSSSASISSFSFARRQNVMSQRNRSPKICAMAKELHFNKDGSAIKKLQVSFSLRLCRVLIYCDGFLTFVIFFFLFLQSITCFVSDWCEQACGFSWGYSWSKRTECCSGKQVWLPKNC